jgi:hypothetical protein
VFHGEPGTIEQSILTVPPGPQLSAAVHQIPVGQFGTTPETKTMFHALMVAGTERGEGTRPPPSRGSGSGGGNSLVGSSSKRGETPLSSPAPEKLSERPECHLKNGPNLPRKPWNYRSKGPQCPFS